MGNGIGWRNKSPNAHLNTTHDIVSKSIQNNNGEIYKIGHHKSRRKTFPFFSSNYDKSLIVTIDGGGTEEEMETQPLMVSELVLHFGMV